MTTKHQIKLTGLCGCVALLGACATEPGLLAEQEGKFKGECNAGKLTLAGADGNVEIEQGEKSGGRINETTFIWYCGAPSQQTRRTATCFEGSNFVQINRDQTGSTFVARCLRDS